MPPEVKQEPFCLTKADSGITSSDGPDASSTEWGDIWSYQVPTGIGVLILPGHTLSVYLEGDDDAEMPATTRIKVVQRDSSQQDEKTLMGPLLYASLKEFTDRDKIQRFNAGPFRVYEKQYLVIEVQGADATGTGGVDQTGGSSDSYFEMNISRVRQPLA